MQKLWKTVGITFLFLFAVTETVLAQEKDKEEILKIDTSLVTIPVIVSDRNDVYLPDLKQSDFQIYEDGKLQEISFFAPIKEPFNVVLMIDTSGSTQEKIRDIQNAASIFVNQLQPADRIKIISFDDEVRDWGNFTNSRTELKKIINDLEPGKGTKLYDAMRLALQNLARVQGRKAIVIFTDGVDYKSYDSRYDENMRMLEESGVIVYPIRYDTRFETEEMVRRQQEQGGAVVLSDIIKSIPTGASTPTTVPGDTKVPTIKRSGGILDKIMTNPPVIRRDRDRYPDNRNPDNRYPQDNRFPDASSSGGSRLPDGGSPRRSPDGGISAMLDNLYKTADQYLNDLALRSGGKLHRADSLMNLPEAFANIANELRNQYSLGYYPINQMRAGKLRKVQVKVARSGAVVRVRPGYREPRS